VPLTRATARARPGWAVSLPVTLGLGNRTRARDPRHGTSRTALLHCGLRDRQAEMQESGLQWEKTHVGVGAQNLAACGVPGLGHRTSGDSSAQDARTRVYTRERTAAFRRRTSKPKSCSDCAKTVELGPSLPPILTEDGRSRHPHQCRTLEVGRRSHEQCTA
jgi:hypothetical protein